MKITVIGLGYVGLSNAILLASNNCVIGVDICEKVVNAINEAKSPIADADIEKYLSEKQLNFFATTQHDLACKDSDFIIIATPTDYDDSKNHLDTSSIESVHRIVRKFNKTAYIIIKSTVPIGYTEKLRTETGDERIIFCPEFLREGKSLWDNLYPSRIIIGTDKSNPNSVEKALSFANLLTSCAIKKPIDVLVINSTEAEAVKLFANTFLALRVSFFNELDTYAQNNNLNAKDIIDAVCLDPRIGSHYNNPSFGYGGYCLPKDTKQLQASYSNIPETLISAVVKSNEVRKNYIASHILELVGYPQNSDVTIGIYRLRMKSKSDNFRQSAIQDIIEILGSKGVSILIYEPLLAGKVYMGNKVTHDLNEFKTLSFSSYRMCYFDLRSNMDFLLFHLCVQ